MTTLIGDFRKPVDPKALAAKGLSGALRYWPKQGGSTTVVGLTAAEIGRYTAAQVPLGTIYEARSASWMSGGAAAGEQAARYLLGLFRKVGGAGWRPASLYLAADANTISPAAVDACLDGAAQVLGWLPDLYGYDNHLAAARDGHARRFWLTGHFPGSSVAAVQKAMPWLHLYQCQGSQPPGIPTTVTVSGVVGDVDIALRPDWTGNDMELSDKITYVARDDGKQHTTTVGEALASAQDLFDQLTKGNGNPGGGPAGWWVNQFLSPDHSTLQAMADQIDTLTQAVTTIAADLAALKGAAQPGGTLTGEATVTVQLNPGSTA